MTDLAPETCTWCWPRPRIRRKANSEWEHLSSGEWTRLCNRCANVRLRNPYSGLLTEVMKTMRKVGSGEQQQEVETEANGG